jgi:dTDP-4-dehydrorhamnose reductase
VNILVTGANGQLGMELRKLAASDRKYQWYFTGSSELDITKKDQVEGFFTAHGIDVCINAASYTQVDKAEEEADKAYLVNSTAVGFLADACLSNRSLLIHISTDYVFNGQHYKPYQEDDLIQAISVYGKSKAEGERLLLHHTCNSIIFRTSWLYAATGHNFVKTMIRLGSERSQIQVVSDQVGSPTWAADLAWAILLAIDKWKGEATQEIFHFSNEGAISWYDFAKSIMELKQFDCKVFPIPSSAYPAKTQRPFYSVLSKEKFKRSFQVEIPYWKDSLKKCLNELDTETKT